MKFHSPYHLPSQLRSLLLNKDSSDLLYRNVVNTPFTDQLLVTQLDLGIVVLLLVNTHDQTIDRVALSDTLQAKGAVSVSAKPFHDIKIPLDAPHNALVQVIKNDTPQLIEDWSVLFTPVLTAEESRRNQRAASIDCSLICPLHFAKGGALIFSFFQPEKYLTENHISFAQEYTKLVENYLTINS